VGAPRETEERWRYLAWSIDITRVALRERLGFSVIPLGMTGSAPNCGGRVVRQRHATHALVLVVSPRRCQQNSRVRRRSARAPAFERKRRFVVEVSHSSPDNAPCCQREMTDIATILAGLGARRTRWPIKHERRAAARRIDACLVRARDDFVPRRRARRIEAVEPPNGFPA
jgi:hypothetical protein